MSASVCAPGGTGIEAESGQCASRYERPQADTLQPNTLVRWTFFISIFCIPFTQIYLPGTGDRIGVTRLVQVLILLAVLSQPRVCIRMIPVALFWFLAYCVLRLGAGLLMTPEHAQVWWPSTLQWLQLSLPWVWVMFNVLQFPGYTRLGLWALIGGCVLCAVLHIAGVGVVEVGLGIEGRTAVFGENANVVGATYAIALIAMIGIGMARDARPRRQLVLLPLIALVGAALAKTGSRAAALILAMGVTLLLFQSGSLGLRARRIATLLLVTTILASVAWSIPTVTQRFEKLDAGTLGAQEGRVRMIPVLVEMFLRSPVHGSGPDGYRFELTRRAMPYLVREQRVISAHNLALLLLVETGVIGFLLFATGVGYALRSAWRARMGRGGLLPLSLLLPLVVAGLIVSNPSHLMVFWLAIAIALAGEA